MSLASILLISIALAMDAFAVSVSSGMTIKELKGRHALKIAGYFGFFQGFMTLLGWVLSFKFRIYVESFSHWIAFILLAVIGGKMVYEAVKGEEGDERDPLKTSVLVVLAIATSIDAMIVGISFALQSVNIVTSSIIIGVVTLIISFVGVFLGKKFGDMFSKNAEILGGCLLIIMGIKIFMEGSGLF